MKKPKTDPNKKATKELKLSRVTLRPLDDLQNVNAVGGSSGPSFVCDQVMWGF